MACCSICDSDYRRTTSVTSQLEWPLSRVRFAGGLGGGFNPPNDFLDPPSLRRFELLGGLIDSILTPVLVLHVSACGASTLLPVGDPP